MRLNAPRGRGAAYFYLSFTTCAWGSLYVGSKLVMAAIAPMALKARRVGGENRTRAAIIEKGDRKYVFLVGFVGYFLAIGALTLGTKLATASVASVINAMNPVFIIFFATLFLKERLTASKILALLAAVSGDYIVLG